MQDDNQEHMQYFLTQKAYENWLLELTASQMFSYFTDPSITGIKLFYLKEYGLPLDSEIKDL